MALLSMDTQANKAHLSDHTASLALPGLPPRRSESAPMVSAWLGRTTPCVGSAQRCGPGVLADTREGSSVGLYSVTS